MNFEKLSIPIAFLIVLLLHVSITVQAQTKRGLIVAIGDYPESGQSPDWRDISSVNDIPLIRSALQKQGFKSDNISNIVRPKNKNSINNR